MNKAMVMIKWFTTVRQLLSNVICEGKKKTVKDENRVGDPKIHTEEEKFFKALTATTVIIAEGNCFIGLCEVGWAVLQDKLQEGPNSIAETVVNAFWNRC